MARSHRAALGVLLCALAAGLGVPAALADGLLPNLPYRYLNPPAALSKGNRRPLSGIRVLPAGYMRAVQSWSIFTQDGQAGVSGGKGALRFSRSASAVTIRLDPVAPPAGLPPQIAVDGNAYRVAAVEQPGGAPVTVTQPITVTLRWPLIPVAMYAYRSGHWQQVCYSNAALITGETMSCRTSGFGIFAAVAAGGHSGVPAQPATSPITRWIPAIAVGAVVLLAAIGAFFISRPRRSRGKSR